MFNGWVSSVTLMHTQQVTICNDMFNAKYECKGVDAYCIILNAMKA